MSSERLPEAGNLVRLKPHGVLRKPTNSLAPSLLAEFDQTFPVLMLVHNDHPLLGSGGGDFGEQNLADLSHVSALS